MSCSVAVNITAANINIAYKNLHIVSVRENASVSESVWGGVKKAYQGFYAGGTGREGIAALSISVDYTGGDEDDGPR